MGSHFDDDRGSNSGSAYIFKYNGSSWIQQSKLTASDGAAEDYFGISVSISGDYAVVGARCDDDHGGNSGSAYIFKYNGISWIQQSKLTASDGAANDYFGSSLSIGGDYIIVGTYDDDMGIDSGSAYIFKRDGTTWIQQQKLLASDGFEGDWFGSSVAISGDYALVGARYDDVNLICIGSAYIFRRDGTTWIQQQKLLASDGLAYDYFGNSVGISGDYAIVGTSQASTHGSAYIFKYNGSAWIEQTKLIASDGANEDYFGVAVSISGNSVIAGANGDDDKGSYSGSAYLFGFSPDEDLNRDCKVNLADFIELSAHWQQTGCPAGCEDADIDASGTVDMTDLLSLVDAWLSGI